MNKFKKWLIPIALVGLLLSAIVGGGCTAESPPISNPSLGEIFDPSGNPFANRFTDQKDIRTATFVVAASDSEHKYDADYRCDGTADNVEIQAAIDALPAGGGIIQLTEGTYNLVEAPTINTLTNITIQGVGWATELYITDDRPNTLPHRVGIYITTSSYISVRSLAIDGNKANQAFGNTEFECIDVKNSNHVTIENCYLHDAYDAGIDFDDTLDSVAIGNYIKSNGGAGFHGSSNSFRIQVLANHSEDNGKVRPWAAFDAAAGGGEFTFVGNTSYDDYSAFEVYAPDCTITGNVIDACTCATGTRGAIHLRTGAHRAIVDGNILSGLSTVGRGIRADDCNDVVISNNVFDSSNWVTIQIYDTCNRFIVTGNQIFNAPAGQNGIKNEAPNSIISGNIIGAGPTVPILNTGANTIIQDNQGHIYYGEIQTASGVLTAGNANAICFAWHNPYIQDILIKKVVIEVTTAGGTVGSHLDVGIADDAAGTNRGVEFFDDLLLNSVQIDDSWVAGDGGTQTKWVFCQDSASATDGWIVGQILDANAGDLVGRYYIEYVGR